jgi:type I restriction enzyme S subunit
MGSFGITGRHDKAACKGPGVIVGRSGASAGVVSYIDEDYWPLNTCLYVKDFKENDPRFAYYFLKTVDLAGLNSGSAQPSLNRNFVHPVSAAFPDPSEQKAIANVLGSLDDKIELNRQMNETLEAMARAIFKDWFVDFGPTRTKMAMRGEDPQKENTAPAPYLAPDIWSLFPDRLDDEGKPEGWLSSTIGHEVTILGGSTPSTKEPDLWGGEISWATPKDLSSLASPILLSTERQITEAGLSDISSGLLPIGTVLLSSRAPIGYLAIAAIPTAVNQGFIAMICNKQLSKTFVWQWAHANMDIIRQRANGSTFQEISKTNFRPIPVLFAQFEILQAYDNLVGPLLDRIAANAIESRSLMTTRDLLLPKLMSGEIRVKDAEKMLESIS